MRRLGRALLCAGAAAASPATLAAGPGPNPVALVQKGGDVLQVGVPLVALGLTFLLDPRTDAGPASVANGIQFNPYAGFDFSLNGSPRHDLALAFARTELVTYSLKYAVDAQRPNGGGQSFPSGHTAVAFTGAEFIRNTYGWGWGIPAYALAGFVGWSRVASNNHYPADVVAGAAIGILANHDLGAVSLPFGSLTIGPALLATGPAPGPAWRLADDLDPWSSGHDDSLQPRDTAFGLNFELRF